MNFLLGMCVDEDQEKCSAMHEVIWIRGYLENCNNLISSAGLWLVSVLRCKSANRKPTKWHKYVLVSVSIRTIKVQLPKRWSLELEHTLSLHSL